jgi:hypothetical protein
MKVARLNVLAAALTLTVLTAGAQSYPNGGPYSTFEVQTPGMISGGGVFHILANEGTPGAHQLIYTNTKAGAWAKVEVLGKRVSGPAVAYHATEGLHVFVVDSTAKLSHRLRSPAGVWGPWGVVGGTGISGKPAAAVWQGKVYAFVVGSDRTIWYTTGNGNDFGRAWARVPGPMATTASPSATADSARLTVVAVNSSGAPMFQQVSGAGAFLAKPFVATPDGPGQPQGMVSVAPGDQINNLWFSAVSAFPGKIAVSVINANGSGSYYSSDQYAMTIKGTPVVARGLAGLLTQMVKLGDDRLMIRELPGVQWGGWAEVKPPR